MAFPSSSVASRWLALTCALIAAPVALVSAAEPDLSELDLQTLMAMDVTLVTAQKRAENVDLVPISMTVLKADTIDGARLTTSADLQIVSPGLSTTQNAGWMLPYIRGVGTDINTSGIEPSVAVYVDGIYQAERGLALVDLADVEQIEVLRGPQGTLYGRNATGGAINIQTRGPTDKATAMLQVGTGNLDLKEGNLFVAGPAGDRLRLSFAANARARDGYYKNLVDGDTVNDQNFYSLHGRAQVKVSDTLQAELLLKYFSRDDHGIYGTQLTPNSIPALLGAPVALRPFETASDQLDNYHKMDNGTFALKLSWDTPLVRVQSTTFRSTQSHRIAFDFDTSAAALQELRAQDVNHAFTQEFQISPAQKSANLDWLLGAFYIDSSGGFLPVRVESTDPALGPYTARIDARIDTQAYAVFGEGTLSLAEAWAVTAGMRYSNENKTLTDVTTGIEGLPLTRFPDREASWDDINYRLVLKHTKDRTLLYAKTETGFKSGAFNNSNPANPGPIDPEQITAYELGMKTQFAHLPVRLTIAAFFNDYQHLQIQIVDTQSGVTSLDEAPKAETYGLDAGIEWMANEHWRFAGGINWLNARYREFTSDGVLSPSASGGNAPVPGLNLAGNHLSRSPEFTGNLATHCDYPLRAGAVVCSVNYYHASRIYFDSANAYSQGAYGLVSAELGFRAKSGWHVLAWAKNLTDEVHLETAVPGVLGTFGEYAEPRTFGISAGISFGN